MSTTPQTCVAVRDDEALLQACGALVVNSDVSAFEREPSTRPRRIAWDLSRVSDIDARGVGVLADAARRAGERGVRVTVRAASAVVHRLATLARLDTVIAGDWHLRRGDEQVCGGSALSG
jgi:anti-anti-sigma factor